MPQRQMLYATKPIGEAAAANYRKGGEDNPGLVPYFVRRVSPRPTRTS